MCASASNTLSRCNDRIVFVLTCPVLTKKKNIFVRSANFDGVISQLELIEGLAKLNIRITKQQEAALLARYSTSTGVVDYRSFMAMVMPNNLENPDERVEQILQKLRGLVKVAAAQGVNHKGSFEHFE